MSVTVTLAELADTAFGTADGGGPRVGALRVLLEHLHPPEAGAQVGEGKRGLPEPTACVAGGQPSHPSGSPGTAERLAPGRPATGARQTVRLKTRMEVFEERMTKVMDMLQEMLTTTCSLKTTIEGFQEELQLLKESFRKAGLEELREQSVQQDEHSHLLHSILDQLAEVRQELSSFPWHATALCRSSLCGVPAGEKLSNQELGPEPSQQPAREVACGLSWLLEQHEAMETHISHCKSQLQQHADSGTLEDMAARLEKVPGEMRHLQDGAEKGLGFGREVLGQLGQLQEQCMRLQEAAERLWGDTRDTQKAAKAAPETTASQGELRHAMVQLSEMMQDVLQRMSLLGQDREKALEKLLSEMSSKLDCMALAPLQTQLEQVWRLTQQCPCQGPCCGANCAAGFRRPLFDPVKCISCNRPLAMALAPHLVTVRKASQLLQPHPATAGGSKCPARQTLGRESKGNGRASRGPASPAGPLSTSSSLITVCPCGDPAGFACKNREVDILGINGVVYKGRLNSPAANGTITMGKDFPAMKTPQPRSRHTAGKTRHVPKYGSHYVSPYSCAPTRTKASSSGGRWQTATGGSRTAGV